MPIGYNINSEPEIKNLEKKVNIYNTMAFDFTILGVLLLLFFVSVNFLGHNAANQIVQQEQALQKTKVQAQTPTIINNYYGGNLPQSGK